MIKVLKRKVMVSIKIKTVVTIIMEGGAVIVKGHPGVFLDVGKVLFLILSDTYMKPCYMVTY